LVKTGSRRHETNWTALHAVDYAGAVVGKGWEMTQPGKNTARDWAVRTGLCAVLFAGTAAAAAPTIAQAGSGQTLMACENARTGTSNVFRSAPRSCALHFANKPFGGDDTAPLGAIRWSGWGKSVARGHGTFHGNMDYTAPSTVVVNRPRRCSNGTRNYTWATIATRGIGSFSGPLAACAG